MHQKDNVKVLGYSVSSPQEDAEKHVSSDVVVRTINASGHVQELDRKFGVWSICLIAIAVDNAWAAGSGSLVVALSNGGGPGVLYELVVACLFYFPIGAALAELASALPSSASVYHWASVTGGPRYGRVCSWYAGWWNFFAWTIGTATGCLWVANSVLGIYCVFHEGFQPERWQIFIAYMFVSGLSCVIVLFGQRILPNLANIGGVVCMAIWLITLFMCALWPSFNGHGHASHSFVWGDWINNTGYSSNGFVFLAGMLNGACTIGTPDSCTHLAEEIPQPKRNIPKGILAQLSTGLITSFLYYMVLLYAITDIDAVIHSNVPSFPLAAIYHQATRSQTGTAILLVFFIVDLLTALPGAYVTAGRMLWTLARDDAVPFAPHIARVSTRFRNPFVATLYTFAVITALGCIYVAYGTAFSAFIGCFTILTTMSYAAAILPHLLTRRRYVKPGPFWMPDRWAYPTLVTANLYIVVFGVIYCFPYTLPIDAQTMNYSVVIIGGLTSIVGIYYLWKRNHGYKGPKVAMEIEEEASDI